MPPQVVVPLSPVVEQFLQDDLLEKMTRKEDNGTSGKEFKSNGLYHEMFLLLSSCLSSEIVRSFGQKASLRYGQGEPQVRHHIPYLLNISQYMVTKTDGCETVCVSHWVNIGV